jgi:hypothetical protein
MSPFLIPSRDHFGPGAVHVGFQLGDRRDQLLHLGRLAAMRACHDYIRHHDGGAFAAERHK